MTCGLLTWNDSRGFLQKIACDIVVQLPHTAMPKVLVISFLKTVAPSKHVDSNYLKSGDENYSRSKNRTVFALTKALFLSPIVLL